MTPVETSHYVLLDILIILETKTAIVGVVHAYCVFFKRIFYIYRNICVIFLLYMYICIIHFLFILFKKKSAFDSKVKNCLIQNYRLTRSVETYINVCQ